VEGLDEGKHRIQRSIFICHPLHGSLGTGGNRLDLPEKGNHPIQAEKAGFSLLSFSHVMYSNGEMTKVLISRKNNVTVVHSDLRVEFA
jgi:hypothetical protein